MSVKKEPNPEHQFLEVDEDLRRIGRREAAKPLCPFGQRCYRKNPDHFKEYRHQKPTDTETIDKQKKDKDVDTNKKNKITHFFKRKPTPVKKKVEVPAGDDSDYRIEDDSDDDFFFGNTTSKDSPKQKSPKRARHSSNEAKDKPSKKNIQTKTRTPNKKQITNFMKPMTIEEIKGNDSDKTNTPKTPEVDQNSSADKKSFINPKISQKELNKLFKEIFLVEMPIDFFQFWQFCKNLKPDKPQDALVEALGLKLVGPYDIMAGKVKKESIDDKEKTLCHWRYYYDLPEMQTIISSVRSGYHLAYFRDSPEEDPIVVSNNGDDCHIEGISDDIFGAIYHEIQKSKGKVTTNKELKTIESKLKDFCNQNKIDLSTKNRLKARKTKVNAKTFNGFGFVVPYNKKTLVGYRELPLNDSDLKKLLNTIIKTDPQIREDSKSVTDLKEIIQLIDYANDECDFGMGLELGIDLFSNGDPFFHKLIVHLLSLAYNLLKRDAFAQIISAHIENRRNGYNLDTI